VEPFLFNLAKAMKKEKKTLRIYDPYYCEGSMVAHLNALGFENVYNRNEDFYEKVATKSTPEFDVLVTNPPYSGDHFKRILSYCRDSNKPWLLLLPNFVCRKSYYAPSIGDAAKPLFLIPDDAKPFLLQAVPVGRYLDALEARDFDVFDEAVAKGGAPLLTQGAIAWHAFKRAY